MKRILIGVALISLLLSGCGMKDSYDGVAIKRQVEVVQLTTLIPPQKSIDLFVKSLQESLIEPEEWKVLNDALAAIMGMHEFLDLKASVNRKISYSDYVSGFNYMKFNYAKISGVLDRASKEGNLDEYADGLWFYIKQTVDQQIIGVETTISSINADINAEVQTSQIDELISIYKTVEPLFSIL